MFQKIMALLKGCVVSALFPALILIQSFSTTTASSWVQDPVHILGFSVVPAEVRKNTYFDSNRRFYVQEKTKTLIRFYGKFTSNTYFSFSTNMNCAKTSKTREYKLQIIAGSANAAAEIHAEIPTASGKRNQPTYLCLREGSNAAPKLQGGHTDAQGRPSALPWLIIMIVPPSVPLWLQFIFIAILLFLSALFSGLNLGLLSLDKTDLKIIINTGSQRERSEASKIVPVRNHGNFLLCCLLFSNVLVNTVLTVFMDQVFGGSWESIAITTLAIVIFGEIAPQAVCSRYGLTVGAKTLPITKFFMFITFPLAYPVGRLLDKMLGEEIGAVYTRDRLKELLKVTRDQHGLETEEVGIISGTLDMKTKTVKEVMTPIRDMFMIPYEAVLNVKLLTDIENKGFTRIPIYHGERENVVGLLNVKQLTLLDPDQNVPVKDQIESHKTHLFCVFENTRLDYMLKAFREGSRGHMAFVQRINDDGPGDPKYETIGLVTLEDVLEELLQAEIYDENDIVRGRTSFHERPSIPMLGLGRGKNQEEENKEKDKSVKR